MDDFKRPSLFVVLARRFLLEQAGFYLVITVSQFCSLFYLKTFFAGLRSKIDEYFFDT